MIPLKISIWKECTEILTSLYLCDRMEIGGVSVLEEEEEDCIGMISLCVSLS